MKSELKDVSPTQKELNIEIDAEALKAAYGKAVKKYTKGASVPGFRKGFAPEDVIRVRFKDEIRSEVLQIVVPIAVMDAVEEHGLDPLVEPRLHLDDGESAVVNGSKPISVHAHVEVMPEIPVPNLDGIGITRRVKPVGDGEIDGIIAERLKKESALIPVEGRVSEIGDTVIADLEGTFDGDETGETIKADDLEVVLGDEVIEKSFTENLIGVKDDDEKEFTVTYADDFTSEALAGKTVHYKAKIKSVGRAEAPELNDEWAVSLDEGYESLADLREKLKADLEAYAMADADARVRNEAVAKMILENAFEVPNTLIENQTRSLLNNFAREMQERGVDLNKVEESFVQMAYENMRKQAERDVRGAMLLDRMAELEKIEVADLEIDAEIARMAEYYRTSPEEVRQSLTKEGGALENIRNNLKTRRAIESVVAKVKVTDGEWISESAEEPELQAEVEKPKKTAKKKEPAKKKAVKTE